MLFFLFNLLAINTTAQHNLFILAFLPPQNDTLATYTFENQSITEQFLINYIDSLQKTGFLGASLDSIFTDSTKTTAFLNRGREFFMKNLNFTGNDSVFVKKVFDDSNNSMQWSMYQLNIAKNEVITYFEDNGYPFASIETRIERKDSVFGATLFTEKGKLIKLDTLKLRGEEPVNYSYIKNYLSFQREKIYSEKEINKISKKIADLSFVKEKRPMLVDFSPEKASIYLYLAKKKSSRFDGILGLVPNDKTQGKTMLTGEINLFLENILRYGEIFKFEWKKLPSSSQQLDLLASGSYFFGTMLGAEFKLNIDKKDTTYLNTGMQLAMNYSFSATKIFKAFIANNNSVILLKKDNRPPSLINASTTLYGFGYQTYNLDYKFNPRRGYFADIKIATGLKSLPDSSDTKQYEAEVLVAGYIPTGKYFCVMLQTRCAIIYNENYVLENEAIRIGGLNSLRGFDERVIPTTQYVIQTVELRYLFEKNSSLFVFSDIAYYEKSTLNDVFSDMPIGFGVGFTFQTKAGIFAMSYALGKQLDAAIQFKTAKIHFGYTSRF